MRFDRVRKIFKEDFKKIQNVKILLLGVGGVGSFCLDCLYRSGVKDITIVDFDRFDATNQNRQIGSENIGELKVEVLKRLYPQIKTINAKVDKNWIESFDFLPYDLVLDAIDDIKAKVALAKKVYPKLISSTGSAKKYSPTKIKVDSIWKTYGDAFAKKFRNELKKAKFNKDFLAIFSPEEPKCKDNGSFVAVTGSFGLTMCSEAIKRIVSS